MILFRKFVYYCGSVLYGINVFDGIPILNAALQNSWHIKPCVNIRTVDISRSERGLVLTDIIKMGNMVLELGRAFSDYKTFIQEFDRYQVISCNGPISH